jgi:hypothetical protein
MTAICQFCPAEENAHVVPTIFRVERCVNSRRQARRLPSEYRDAKIWTADGRFGSQNETARAVERCAQGSAWG